MSEENLEVVRQLYPGRIDLAAVFRDPDRLTEMRRAIEPLVDPDLETVGEGDAVPMGELATGLTRSTEGLTAHGLDGFVSFWRDWLSAWDTWVLDPPEIVEVDQDRVLVTYDVHARSKTHQVEMVLEGANLLTLNGRRVKRLELFFDRSEARRAAGLQE
jgi:hypothetical protein